MSHARRELFVYYRVKSAQWRDAALAVERLQQQLRQSHAGLTARLLRRPETADDLVTLMEVYALEGVGVTPEIEADIAHAASVLEPWLVGERHCEGFDALE